MRKLIAIGTLAAATVVGGVLDAAHADAPDAAGFTCAFSETSEVLATPGSQVGQMYGGPVAVADLPVVDDSTTPPTVTYDATGNPASGTITCALQVGGTGAYAEPDQVAASASGTAVVYFPPTLISYQAASFEPVWSCTTWTLTDAHGDSQTLFLDDATGEFLTDPATATCALATGQSIPPVEVCITLSGCYRVPDRLLRGPTAGRQANGATREPG